MVGDSSHHDGEVCVPADDGEEICNEIDDDCDGEIDEDFDLQTDPTNCGFCDRICRADNAEVACRGGRCEVEECFAGFADLDPDMPGCEYRCPVFPAATEDCNGFDDDCDGMVDEADELPAPPAGLCRETPGTPCAGVVPVCTTREGRTSWFCAYPATVEFDPSIANGIALEETKCDGFDGDCDGVADDVFPGLGTSCDNGLLGACRDVGVIACDPADDSQTHCDLTALPDATPGAPSAELCNAVDDNCDGIIDNSDPMDPDRIIDDMVHVTHGGADFWVYRFEASRPDASDGEAGVSSSRACSRGGVLPWSTVGYNAARSACEVAGYRLCTGAEWLAACEGAGAQRYPYGGTYAATTCNGADRDAVPGGRVDHVVTLTGELPMCISEDGAFDLSGNVKEWTRDRQGTVGGRAIHVVRGGSFESPELGLSCATDLSRATVDTTLPTLGFRCCSSSAP